MNGIWVDEYISTPIGTGLFLAKVRVWLRRCWTVSAEALETVQASEFQLDPVRRQLTLPGGSSFKLTNLEFRVLYLLMTHEGQVLMPDVLVTRVWGYGEGQEGALLKNVIYRLRRKLESDPNQPRYIQTVAGEGYKFQAP
jgi:DNA-binding response OmpR family regulator